MRLMKVNMYIESIFGPIYISALIYALSKLKQDQTIKYYKAITIGFHNWGRLLVTRFVAGFFVLLGFIALIIPGILLAIRYAMINSVVVLESAGISESRWRSSELTKEKRWQIFWAFLLFYLVFFCMVFVIQLPVDIIEELGFISRINSMIISTVIDCALELIYAVITIVMFLFYWESKDKVQYLDDDPHFT